MARTARDEVEDKVRTRLQEAMVSAGLSQSRISLEVLFWLPAEFVREYQELFLRGLHLGDGDDGEKAGEDEGRLVAKVPSRLRGKKGGMAAQGGGKRYKREWIVKDERALAVKGKVDRKLVDLIRRANAEVRESHGERGGGEGSRGGRGGESHGGTPGGRNLVPLTGSGDKMRCEGCGRIAASDWVRCPYPHA